MSKFVRAGEWIINLDQISAIKATGRSVTIHVPGVPVPFSYHDEQAKAIEELLNKTLSPDDWNLPTKAKSPPSDMRGGAV